MISVIIPAFNEATVIERTLQSVLASSAIEPKEGQPTAEVFVVCNGCQDDTAERAKRFGDAVKVISLEQGSKIAALNAGDAAATLFPRFYLDADIEVSPNALSAVASVLNSGTIHAAAPRMVCDENGASWPVRAFYKTWLSRPYHRAGHVGSGFVGISREGRSRFRAFPNIIADDEFLRRQFSPEERRVIDCEYFKIHVPKTLPSLIKVKTRSRLGTLQLASAMPELTQNVKDNQAAPAFPTSEEKQRPSSPGVFDKLAYGTITLLTRARASHQFRKGQFTAWERDETSR